MVELSPEEITRRERALIDDYGTAGTSLIQKVGQAAEQAFYDLPDYRGFANRDEYVDVYEQILFGARIEAARTSIAFHREIARLRNKSFSYVKPRPEHYFAKNLRQLARSSSTEPYQMRPFREVYKELSKSGSMTDAVRAGGARARILAQTDVQLARRRASLFARMQEMFFGLAQTGGLGYEIKQVGTGLVFDVFEPVDRSAFVRLDIENGRLEQVEYQSQAPLVTRAIVAGAGELSSLEKTAPRI